MTADFLAILSATVKVVIFIGVLKSSTFVCWCFIHDFRLLFIDAKLCIDDVTNVYQHTLGTGWLIWQGKLMYMQTRVALTPKVG